MNRQKPLQVDRFWRRYWYNQWILHTFEMQSPEAEDQFRYSTVVFWIARGKPLPCHNYRLFGEQRGEEIFRPLPEFEAFVGIQDQPLNECLRLLTTRFPNGFDG